MSCCLHRLFPLVSGSLLLLGALPLQAKVIWLQIGQDRSLEYTVNVPSLERRGEELTVISQVRTGGTELSFPTRIDCAHQKVTHRVPNSGPIPQTVAADSRIGRNYLQLCYFN